MKFSLEQELRSAKLAGDVLSRTFAKATIKSQIWLGFGRFLAIFMFGSLSTLGVFGHLNRGIAAQTNLLVPNAAIEAARAAVDAISQGRQKATASVDSASNAGAARTEIAASVATISNMNIQRAAASEQQSAVAAEISENVVNIKAVADENARASNMLAAPVTTWLRSLRSCGNQLRI